MTSPDVSAVRASPSPVARRALSLGSAGTSGSSRERFSNVIGPAGSASCSCPRASKEDAAQDRRDGGEAAAGVAPQALPARRATDLRAKDRTGLQPFRLSETEKFWGVANDDKGDLSSAQ
jgi:hypothetical protein